MRRVLPHRAVSGRLGAPLNDGEGAHVDSWPAKSQTESVTSLASPLFLPSEPLKGKRSKLMPFSFSLSLSLSFFASRCGKDHLPISMPSVDTLAKSGHD